MARALMGHIGPPSEQVLALEIGRLRRRVANLEAEVSALREHAASAVELDLELHRIAQSAAPALA